MCKAFLLTVKFPDVQMELPGLVCVLLALALGTTKKAWHFFVPSLQVFLQLQSASKPALL